MESGGGGRLPVHVLGENEALQQFFDGQDMRGVLESTAVDTSILEQFLSNDMDPNNFMLPESPPDSGSEPCSPPQIADLHYDPPHWSNDQNNQEVFQPMVRPTASSSCRFNKDRGPAPSQPELPTHEQLCCMGLTNTFIKAGTPPTPAGLPHSHQSPLHTQYLSPESYAHVSTPPVHNPLHPPTPSAGHPSPPHPAPCLAPADGYPRAHGDATQAPGLNPGLPNAPGLVPSPPACMMASTSGQQTGHPVQPESKKRRRSGSCSPDTLQLSGDVSCYDDSDGANGPSGSGVSLGPYQLLTWEPYKLEQWSTLYDGSYQMLPPPAYHVDTDKGFNYSPADEAFVCQKKNHFQVTVHVGMAGEPRYIRTPSGPQHIDYFQVKVFGVKMEAPGHQVTIEQSQADRSKKAFHPVRVSLPGDKITKVTLGRLHFSETTANNMRKKGKPNPDQRYFLMVVGLYATVRDESYLLTALVSEKIIVRASNPGQFETESDALWQRGVVQDSVVFQGRVGINTDSPDEALVVCGNAKIMGAVMHPSDRRAKENIQEVDSEEQLKRIAQMRIVEYDYRPAFASSMGIDHVHETGIIAQEVKELLPAAVTEVGAVTCSDGETIPNFLMVDKEQIFMENVGAVKQLCKLTDNLETRIKELEVWNTRLAKLKNITGSLRSKGKPSKHTSVSITQKPCSLKPGKRWRHCLQHKVFQASIFTLVATMAFCVISIAALYLLTLREDDTVDSNGSVFPPQSTPTWTSTASPSPHPDSWPPDVDFCDLLYCQDVYCCPSTPGGTNLTTITTTTTTTNTTATVSPKDPLLAGKGKEKLFDGLKNDRDWTNTTIQSFFIKENQQMIDGRYCETGSCGSGRYSYVVPIGQYVPVNMRVTLVMNATELLVVHLCGLDESSSCSALLGIDTVTGSRYPSDTQGEHEWPLHVARLHQSYYHFRSTVAGQADCNTDRHYAGVLFTDYHFHFYRRCTGAID